MLHQLFITLNFSTNLNVVSFFWDVQKHWNVLTFSRKVLSSSFLSKSHSCSNYSAPKVSCPTVFSVPEQDFFTNQLSSDWQDFAAAFLFLSSCSFLPIFSLALFFSNYAQRQAKLVLKTGDCVAGLLCLPLAYTVWAIERLLRVGTVKPQQTKARLDGRFDRLAVASPTLPKIT